MALKNYILVCGGTACESSKADSIYQALVNEIEANGLKKDVQDLAAECIFYNTI